MIFQSGYFFFPEKVKKSQVELKLLAKNSPGAVYLEMGVPSGHTIFCSSQHHRDRPGLDEGSLQEQQHPLRHLQNRL